MRPLWIAALLVACAHHADRRPPCERAAEKTWRLESAAWSDEERAALAPNRAEALASWTAACASWTAARVACTLAARAAADLAACPP
jgi:hypothetical protein